MDQDPIRYIPSRTYATSVEADPIVILRERRSPLISLVAEQKETIVGQILFSPVTLVNENAKLTIAGTGPIYVLPAWQNKGIGSKLVMAGLQECEKADFHAVVVLDARSFFRRFGFRSSVAFGTHSEYHVPADVLMVKKLTAGAFHGVDA